MATVTVAGRPMKRDISQLARICEGLFLQYTDPRLESTKKRTRAEIQLQRFNVWVSYLGVFAEDNASLDKRLEHSDEIQNLVLQLLLLLQANLEFVNSDELKEEQAGSNLGAADDFPKTESELKLDGTVSEALDTVEATINRLNRLGSTIRKYSTSSLDSRVKAFTERHGDANYTALAKQIVYFKYRTAPPSLQEQLALSMSARRQRLRYIRRHQEKLATHQSQKKNNELMDRSGTEYPRLPSPKRIDEVAPDNAPTDGPSGGKKRALNNRPLVGFFAPTSVNTKASTFRQTPSLVAKLQITDGTSVVSSSKQSKTIMAEDRDDYPDPPKKEAGKPEPTCPYCCQPLQDPILKLNNWRKHVDQDLHPFICISEKCNQQPPLAFPDSEIWANHMREAHSAKWTQLIHKPFVWRCDVGHLENVGIFADEKSFEDHLDNQHGDCGPAARKAISSACKVFQKRDRNLCPLCGFDVSAPDPGEASASAKAKPEVDRATQLGKLAKHIAGHLRHLAFDSSSNLDCVFEEDGASQDNIETSNPIERDGSKTHPPSGLKDLSEVSLSFIDDIATQGNYPTVTDRNSRYDVEYFDYAPGSSPPEQEDLNWVQSWTLWRDNNDALCQQPDGIDRIIEHFKVKSIQDTHKGVDVLFDLCVNVFSLCSNYSDVAEDDVQRLQRTLDMLKKTLQDVQLLLDSPNDSRFGTSQSIHDGLNGCSSQLSELKKRLETEIFSGTDGMAAPLRATTLQWPFENKDVDTIVVTLEQYRQALSPTVDINRRFQRALENFKQGLKRRDQESFKNTTHETLNMSLGTLQVRQHATRRLHNLNRLVPLVNAIQRYGEVIQMFCKNSEIMAFIWGPFQLLLEVASSHDRAFSELLDVYERMGQDFPLLGEYLDIFRTKPHMVQILVLIYEDIIRFHQMALSHFQKPRWEELFDVTWNMCKTRLLEIISVIAKRRSSIENQARVSQTEDMQMSRPTEHSSLDVDLEKGQLHRRLAVLRWLGAADPDADQYRLSKIRADYPGTGRWLLDNPSFKEWFDPRYPAIPPLLWLKGLPGAGKTILASLVVEEAHKLTPPVTVLFFYCRHDKPEKNSFDALARSFLLQLLKQDKGVLTYLYQKCCDSAEAVLGSSSQLKELLAFAFEHCERAYIVIDGLDECARDERKVITQWFTKLVETLPITYPDRLRCLFLCQDDGVARKDLVDLVSIKIGVEDNKHDIYKYGLAQANKLKEKFELSVEEASRFATNVADAARGMFLLARLVWTNLLGQTSIAGVEGQLGNNFPDGIDAAYERILDRIVQQASPAAMEDISWLLGWLVCSKRSLKWHEIQILKSINLDERSVEVERNKFRVSAKDLFESLVEIQPDGTLELVHATAKFFFVRSNRYVDVTAKELEIACRCIDYLNLPAFEGQPTEHGVLKGEYGFMDYAVLYWVRHLEAGTIQANGYDQLMNELAGSLETFIRQYWRNPTATVPVSAGTKKRLRYFQDLPFYGSLEQAIASSKKQLRHFGEMRKGEIALSLPDTVEKIRNALEQLISSDLEPSVRERIEERYGSNLFKCPRFSCQFFTTGFRSAQDRDSHIGKHTRPFRCADEACTGFAFGFSTAAERDKHLKNTHSTATTNDLEFPTDEDVVQSIQNSRAEEQATQEPTEFSASEPEAEQQQLPQRTRSRQTEFRCPHCPNVYTKKYNLMSHLRSHTG